MKNQSDFLIARCFLKGEMGVKCPRWIVLTYHRLRSTISESLPLVLDRNQIYCKRRDLIWARRDLIWARRDLIWAGILYGFIKFTFQSQSIYLFHGVVNFNFSNKSVTLFYPKLYVISCFGGKIGE